MLVVCSHGRRSDIVVGCDSAKLGGVQLARSAIVFHHVALLEDSRGSMDDVARRILMSAK
jgi:hypothetical protein